MYKPKYITYILNMKNKLFLGLSLISMILLFIKMPIINESVITACILFVTRVYPSLLPMLIICDIFLYFDLPLLFAKSLGKFFKIIFHSSSYGPFIFIISLFSGTPTNVYVLKKLYLEKKISLNEANKFLSFSYFANPLFLYTMLTFIFKNNKKIILPIFIMPYIVNTLIGIFSRKTIDIALLDNKTIKEEFGTYFVNSIKNAMNTLLMILGVITIFYIIGSLINPSKNIILTGLLELTSGLYELGTRNINISLKALLAIIFINFGGLSIHLQVKGIISDTLISYLSFIKGRVIATIISIILFFLIQ